MKHPSKQCIILKLLMERLSQKRCFLNSDAICNGNPWFVKLFCFQSLNFGYS